MAYYLKKHKAIYTLTIIISVIGSIGSALIAVLLERILDLAVSGDMSGFNRLLIFSVAYFAVLTLFLYLYSLMSKYFINTVSKSLRDKVFTGVISRHFADFQKSSSADYLSALTNDVKIIEDNYLSPLLTIIQSSVIFGAGVVIMFYFDAIVALCTLGAILFMFIIPGLFGSAIQKRQERYSGSLSDFTNHSKDMLSGFEVIKTYGIIGYVKKRFENSNKNVKDAKYGVDKVLAVSESLSMLLGVLVQTGAIFLAAYFIINGRISVGALLGIAQATGMLVAPLSGIFQNMPMIKGARPVVERIEALTSVKAKNANAKSPGFERCISAENLRFSYDGGNEALSGTSIDLQKSGKYAIVGKSGCGKTTFVRLMCGYYHDYDGNINYDGTELRELDYDGIVGLSSAIHQGVYIFNESIFDNICLHREYSDEQLQRALDISGVSGFIINLPDGLDTIAEENGANLSGGQKQRIAVARAIIQGKPVLVLDEGTSAIDMQTAFEIESNLLDLDDLTLITITHNLNEENLKRYEQIIYMDSGTVAETGTYDELLRNQGRFYEFSRV